MSRIKKCLHCAQPFIGRRDAKTCSARCRKALQRKRDLLDDESSLALPGYRSLPKIRSSEIEQFDHPTSLGGLAGSGI